MAGFRRRIGRAMVGSACTFTCVIAVPGARAHDGSHQGQTLLDHLMTSLIDLGAVIVVSLPLIAGLHYLLRRSGRARRPLSILALLLGAALLIGSNLTIASHAFAGTTAGSWYRDLAVWWVGLLVFALGVMLRRRVKSKI
ncbi:MAG: hypothetical protein V3V97_20560 [Hyphomicrobiaceae bacterium]